jgi:3-oxoacyl-[acyl-carrier-protein] synthase II
MATRHRVLVAGLGPISAIGIGREDFAEGLAEGREGIREVHSFNPAAYDFDLAAECLDFAVEDYIESEKTYLDRCSELTLAACALALEDAGLKPGNVAPERLGLALGSAYGALDSMWAHTERVQRRGVRRASSVLFLHSFANTPTSLASIEFDIQGPVATFCSGMASSGAALQFGADLIADGRADVVLAGGVDALSETLYAALDDEGRIGPDFVPGEGAALLALASPDALEACGASPLAEVLAVGLGNEPLDGEAAARAAGERALAQAGLAEDSAQSLSPPAEYGRPFGATCAMDVCAAICRNLPDSPVMVVVSDPCGLACAVIVGKP